MLEGTSDGAEREASPVSRSFAWPVLGRAGRQVELEADREAQRGGDEARSGARPGGHITQRCLGHGRDLGF